MAFLEPYQQELLFRILPSTMRDTDALGSLFNANLDPTGGRSFEVEGLPLPDRGGADVMRRVQQEVDSNPNATAQTVSDLIQGARDIFGQGETKPMSSVPEPPPVEEDTFDPTQGVRAPVETVPAETGKTLTEGKPVVNDLGVGRKAERSAKERGLDPSLDRYGKYVEANQKELPTKPAKGHSIGDEIKRVVVPEEAAPNATTKVQPKGSKLNTFMKILNAAASGAAGYAMGAPAAAKFFGEQRQQEEENELRRQQMEQNQRSIDENRRLRNEQLQMQRAQFERESPEAKMEWLRQQTQFGEEQRAGERDRRAKILFGSGMDKNWTDAERTMFIEAGQAPRQDPSTSMDELIARARANGDYEMADSLRAQQSADWEDKLRLQQKYMSPRGEAAQFEEFQSWPPEKQQAYLKYRQGVTQATQRPTKTPSKDRAIAEIMQETGKSFADATMEYERRIRSARGTGSSKGTGSLSDAVEVLGKTLGTGIVVSPDEKPQPKKTVGGRGAPPPAAPLVPSNVNQALEALTQYLR